MVAPSEKVSSKLAQLQTSITTGLLETLKSNTAQRQQLIREYESRADDYRTFKLMRESPDRVQVLAKNFSDNAGIEESKELTVALLATLESAYRAVVDQAGSDYAGQK